MTGGRWDSNPLRSALQVAQLPRPKKKYMLPKLAPQPVAPAPPKPERISYAGLKEAREASGISLDELGKAIKAGRLPAEISGRPFLILRADLEEYIKGQEIIL